MSAEQFISELQTLDIRLSVENGRLRVNAPKGKLTSELERRIVARKPELLHTLTAAKPSSLQIPPRSETNTHLPLSFAQERFWFLQNLDPTSTAYNITAFQRVHTHVDQEMLKHALRSIVQKHEVLRTVFPEHDGSPVQLVQEASTPEVVTYDFAALNSEEKTGAFESAIQELSQRPFNLSSDALFRTALVRLNTEEHIIVLTMHHIICDAWSIGIFFTELTSSYKTALNGNISSDARLPVQYADYTLWERDRQHSSTVQSQIKYWKKKLKNSPRKLDLPPDRTTASSLIYKPKAHFFQLDHTTSTALKAFALREGATQFMMLLAIFKMLLSRYSKQQDIVVGTPVSTRTFSELEHLIGCFINTQVLRTEVTAEQSARELLAKVRTTVLESLDNADVPFEELLGQLASERESSSSPLFQVAFILQNTPKTTTHEIVSGGTAFDITLYMGESNGSIGGCFEYNSALFHPETIAGLAASYATLAAEITKQPDTPIEQLPMITVEQEEEWFAKYDGANLAVPPLCTHEWIAQQVTKTPDAMAVTCGFNSLTYRELDSSSNRLAHRLKKLGVGPDSIVALCLDRSVDLVVATLAIWKAGGAYVPLDPEFPANRLDFMIADSAPVVLITESHLLKKLPQKLPAIICLDRDRQVLQSESSLPTAPSATPDHIAYILYTSGSTGKPKGVAIRHRSLTNFLSSMQHCPGIDSSDRLLAVTTLSFDIAGLELYLPLISGARVVIAPRSAVFSGAALAKLLYEEKITIMQATPITWRLLLESGWQGTPGLKVLCGGEALSRDLAEQLVNTGSEVWNLYGPTETTIWSTMQRISSGYGWTSIGKPIANTQVHVLDELGLPVPLGVSGELYIGGQGLAKEYLHREELTAQRFIHSSFHAGKRLYRTGDMVRRLPNGDLEYLGRIDHQVKLRGFRIELGEIEKTLEQQPGISLAAVIIREDRTNDPQLVAYIAGNNNAAPDVSLLRKNLLASLPDYMIPSAFVPIEKFPLTPNQKIDRKALLSDRYRPDPEKAFNRWTGYLDTSEPDGTTSSRNEYMPPSNHVEFVMCEIWQTILCVENVSILDNFFELGGHSLTAGRLILQLRSALRIDLPLLAIFTHPTIKTLSDHISYEAATRSYKYTSELPKWNCLVPAQPYGPRTPFFFVAGYEHADDTLMVLSRLIPNLGTDQPVFGFRPRWIEGNSEGYESVDEMAREFVTELRAVQPKGPYLLGGHCVGGIAALEVARLLIEDGEEVEALVLLDTERPTRLRTFITDYYFLQKRLGHIMSIFSDMLFGRNGTRRRDIVRNLMSRKLKIALSRAQATDRFYQLKVRYRRLLYSHTLKSYQGCITLIVNARQADIDKDLGWTNFAQNGLNIHTVPGNHDTILTDYSKNVAEVILTSINSSLKGQDTPNTTEACLV